MSIHLLFGLAIFLGGCTSSFRVTDEPSDDEWAFEEVNYQTIDRSFTIVTTSGREIRGSQLQLGIDSTTFVDGATRKRVTILTSDVSAIALKDHGVGALQGAGFGALAGLMAMTARVLISPNPAWPYGVAVIFSVLGGIAGIPPGALIGGVIGQTDLYVLRPVTSTTPKAK